MVKKKPIQIGHKQKEEVNKKAIIWTVSVAVAIVVIMTVMLILSDK